MSNPSSGQSHPPEQMEPVEEEKEPTFKEKFVFIMKNLTIEPMIVLYCLSQGLMALPSLNFKTLKACRVNFNYSEEICDVMVKRPENSTIDITEADIEVQNLTNHLNSITIPISSSVPIILLLFWGSWSDRHRRRKPCIMLPMLGDALGALVHIAAYFMTSWPMEVVGYVPAIIAALSGGGSLLVLGVLSYIADVSDAKQRTMRIGAIVLIFSIVTNIGNTFSGDVLELLGPLNVFIVVFVICVAALLYGFFVVKEKHENEPVDPALVKKNFLVDFFDKKSVIEALVSALKNGANKRRLKILLLLLAFFLTFGPDSGEVTPVYNYLRQTYNWNEVQIGHFVPVQLILYTVGTTFCLSVLSTHFSVHDGILAILACCSRAVGNTTLVFATKSWHLYMSTAFSMFSNVCNITLKAIVSKIVAENEQGKMNSLFSVVEAICPLAFSKIMAEIYENTVGTYPGAYFGVGALLNIPAICIFYWLYHRSKVDAKHEAESKKDVEAQDKKAGIDNVNYLDDKGNAIEMSRL